MQTEIEIKFFVASDIQPELSNLLNSLEIKESSQQQLGNVYFDTPTLALRQLEMGLRIRRCDAFAEQTIKCRGQVVGGLHARPEYNAPVSGDLPTLSAFPDEIWPTLTERDHIQQQLVAQFRTDFLRRHWLIAFEGTEIELAWDQGEIVGSQGSTTINELELELKSGATAALFALARRLARIGGLRLGAQSKAQRGYRLAGLGKPLALQALVEHEGMDGITGVSEGLRHWQHHEQLWLEHPQDKGIQQQALAALCQGIDLVARSAATLPQPAPWLPALTNLQAQSDEQNEWPAELADLFLYPAYVELQLDIAAWLHHAA
ncbi:CYTH domain-containing protein [Aeromonas veronii]|uniref:CYTH domain-containing protein n=1 Tax=Aeromonas TaxID=642 RepID=UPI00071848CF|nr:MULTISPECIES: CYTH domain-containing protein [Aeromonas]HDN9002748.1 CYTH domain-containing protein [Aeromonas veronii AMC24]KRV91748.1 adenylate cyclase [Aeromonas veronii]KRW02562.1 adenylate cyclase [Aeromonas veronii]KRW10119.1 adenylate cyclase [Aeromonas veronii]KRW10570.1 adenylate cyclase [Aeromonas veronii]